MKRINLQISLFWLLASLLVIVSGKPEKRHVILLGVDGLAAGVLKERMALGQAPTFSRLQREGSWTWQARSSVPTVSLPNWMSILTGTSSQFHGVHSNDYILNRPLVLKSSFRYSFRSSKILIGVVYSPDGACTLPANIFSVLRSVYLNESLGAFYEWGPIGNILQPEAHLNQSLLSLTDDESVDKALDFIATTQPLLTFLYFDLIDETGHKYGFSPEYNAAISHVDHLISRLLNLLTTLGMDQNTLLLLVTDHGRKMADGHYHGSFTDSQINTFWAVRGPRIRPNHHLQSFIANSDSAPTILEWLGLPTPIRWYSRPVFEAFEGYVVKREYEKVVRTDPTRNGWDFQEERDAGKYFECLSDFKLRLPWIWGTWDISSFIVGMLSGFLLSIVTFVAGFMLVGWFCIRPGTNPACYVRV